MQSRITRKLKPVVFVYHMAGSQLEVVSTEKDLGVYITDNLTWHKQVNVQCAKASRFLGYVRRNTWLVKTITGRRLACLTLVRSLLAMPALTCVQTSPLPQKNIFRFFSKRGGTSVHRLYHASVNTAVNRPDSKGRACPEARYKVYPGSTIHLWPNIKAKANES